MSSISTGKERGDWTQDERQSIIWSDKSKFNLFGMMGEFCAKKNWRRLTAGMYTANLEGGAGGGGGGGVSVVVCGCNSCDGIGPITKVKGRMNGKDCIRFYLDTCFPTCNQWDLGKF